jgi:hypothetical protein
MKKKCFSIIFIILTTNLSAKVNTPSTTFHLKKIIEQNSKKDIYSDLARFVQNSNPSRLVGTIGHEKSHQYLLQEIKNFDNKNLGELVAKEIPVQAEIGKKLYQNDFDEKVKNVLPPTDPQYKKWLDFTNYMIGQIDSVKQFPVKNISWEKKGINSKKTLVVTAHYDTVTYNKDTLRINNQEAMPGADYNASGVTIALQLIKIFSQIDLNYNLRVVFLDYQAFGFLGAYEEAEELKKRVTAGEEVLGVINLEMLGFDSKFFDKEKKNYNMKVYFRSPDKAGSRSDLNLSLSLQQLGKKFNSKIQFEPVNNNFSQSDQFRFWDANLGAICYSQNWENDFNEKNYQTSQDIPETINQDTFYAAYVFLSGAIGSKLLDLVK